MDGSTGTEPAIIVLFDGDCGFCRSWVRFAIAHDPNARLRFAPLDGEVGRRIAEQHGYAAPTGRAYRSILVIDRDRLLDRSDAVLAIAGVLVYPRPLSSAMLRGLRGVARMLPRPIRDWLYDRVAAARHRIARRDSCPLTEESMDRGMRERFLD